MFACRTLDSGQDAVYGLAHLQRALAPSGYWTQNMLQVCYEGVHAAAYVPSALVVLGLLSLAPPLTSYLLLRGKPRQELRVRKVRPGLVAHMSGQRPPARDTHAHAHVQGCAAITSRVCSDLIHPLPSPPQVYGFFYEEFKPEWYFWQSIAQLQTLTVGGWGRISLPAICLCMPFVLHQVLSAYEEKVKWLH